MKTEWDSGPFCQHWRERGCQEYCVCGHKCEEHKIHAPWDGECWGPMESGFLYWFRRCKCKKFQQGTKLNNEV